MRITATNVGGSSPWYSRGTPMHRAEPARRSAKEGEREIGGAGLALLGATGIVTLFGMFAATLAILSGTA